MRIRQNSETQLGFAMFDFEKVNTARQNSDDGPNDSRMLLYKDKTASSIASTKMRALPGSGQTS